MRQREGSSLPRPRRLPTCVQNRRMDRYVELGGSAVQQRCITCRYRFGMSYHAKARCKTTGFRRVASSNARPSREVISIVDARFLLPSATEEPERHVNSILLLLWTNRALPCSFNMSRIWLDGGEQGGRGIFLLHWLVGPTRMD